jgi:hypothetical protein
MSGSSEWSFSFWFSHQNPVCIPLLFHACYIPLLDHSNYNWRRVQSMKLITIITSSIFGPNILLGTLFSNILSLWKSVQCYNL